MEIIGYHIDENGAYNSNGEFSKDVAKFLLDKPVGSIGLFSDLDSCVAHIVKHMKLYAQNISHLLNSQSKMCHLNNENYTIQYYPSKHFLLGIGWVKNYSKVSQFSNASQYNVELGRVTQDGMLQARMAKEIGEDVAKIYEKIGFEVNSLVSPVNAFNKNVFKNVNLPKLFDIPSEAGWMAFQACKGGWCEAYKLGHFDNVFDYDLNSSYPYQTKQLWDLRKGVWTQGTKIPRDAKYGYSSCDFKIEKDFSPVTWQSDSNAVDKNFTPTNEFSETVNLRMLMCIEKYDIGDYKINDGWWWIPTTEEYVIDKEVDKFYQMKKEAIGLEREVIKTILVGGFYGLFLQSYNDIPSVNYMPPYACEIQTGTRLDVYEKCIKEDVKPLHIAIDGVITDKEFKDELGTEIGQWKLNAKGNALIVSSGVKCMQGIKGTGDFSFGYGWLMNEIKNNPEKSSYGIYQDKVMSVPLAWQRSMLQDIGKVFNDQRNVTIGIENKRVYKETPRTGGDLISKTFDSVAWDMKILEPLQKMLKNEKYKELIYKG